MFSSSLFRSLSARSANLSRSFHSRCDDASPDDGGFDLNSSFDRSSNAEEQPRFKQPMLYENLMGTLRQGSVNSYDGFRVIVQKQVNLNTIASHFYWIGSQSAPPIYQYRLILPFEDKSINVATDCDFNIECEVRCPLGVGVNAKSNFSIHEQQGNNLSVDIDMTDESSATQMVYSPNGNTFSMSYMQSLNNSIIIGGMGEYLGNKNALNLSFGGVYDDKENLLAAQWDTNLRLLFLKRVNPNRVHLSADLVMEAEATNMTLCAEYILKQSKLQMSIDSNMLLKSYLETQIGPGFTMQFCAEMLQHKEHYRFGYGIQMM